jgi:coenzyme F420-reducing hydrogenase delta subunit/NAD-dependent dihydropyrimidine dehydrogenase PreA subunit
MPADPAEVRQATEEGVEIVFLAAPTKIEREKGQLAVTFIRMQLGEPDASGRPRPVPVQGSEFKIDTDTLITATGQAPRVPEDFHLRIGRGSTIRVDPVTLTTNRLGVFAGGDAVTGPATVTQALATGRQAAFRIDDYLQHRYPSVAKDEGKALTGNLLSKTVEMIRKLIRCEPPNVPTEARVKEFIPVELVYDWETAVNEARRCLRCGMGAEILFQDKCATCLTCLRVCPYHVPYLDNTGTIQIPPEQCVACGICVAECPARAIVLRKPADRRQIDEELDHVLKSAAESRTKSLIIGFCCQYGLYGTGALATVWREAKAGIWIVPVPCIAKIETEHIMRAFGMHAEGVFVAGCGQKQCARENTAYWALQRIEKGKKLLKQIGLEPQRIQAFNLYTTEDNLVERLDRFTEQIGELYLASTIKQEVKT